MAEQRVSCGRDFFCVPDLAAALKNATNGGYRGLSLLLNLLKFFIYSIYTGINKKMSGKTLLWDEFIFASTTHMNRSPRSLSTNAYLGSFPVSYVDTILWRFYNGYWLNYRIHGHSLLLFPCQSLLLSNLEVTW